MWCVEALGWRFVFRSRRPAELTETRGASEAALWRQNKTIPFILQSGRPPRAARRQGPAFKSWTCTCFSSPPYLWLHSCKTQALSCLCCVKPVWKSSRQIRFRCGSEFTESMPRHWKHHWRTELLYSYRYNRRNIWGKNKWLDHIFNVSASQPQPMTWRHTARLCYERRSGAGIFWTSDSRFSSHLFSENQTYMSP